MPNEPLQKTKKRTESGEPCLSQGTAFRAAKLRTFGAGRRNAALLLGLVLTVACDPDAGAPPAPADLLTPATLVPLLADLHVAEARAQHSARAADTVQALYHQQEAAIFRRRGLSAGRFQRSYAYYAGRPTALEAIYAALTDTLAMRQVRLRATTEKK